jgi:hypothetical protein
LLIGFALCWSGFWWFLRKEDVGTKADLADVAVSLADPDMVWAREDTYYGVMNMQRLKTVLAEDQIRRPVATAEGRVRVLVFGDSFTYGQGLTDLDARWGNQLQDMLNKQFGSEVFEIVVLARQGANMTTYGDWVRRLSSGDVAAFLSEPTKEYGSDLRSIDAARLQGPFDMVLLGFVDNDYLATEDDPYIPQEQLVKVPVEQWTDIAWGKLPNPNERFFLQALQDVRDFAEPVPFVLLPLTPFDVNTHPAYNNFPLVQDTGVTVASNQSQRALEKKYGLAKIAVTPVDTHPGPAWQHAIAQDALRAVLAAVPQNRIATAQARKQPTAALLSNYLPPNLQVQVDQDSATVSYAGTERAAHLCGSARFSLDRFSECDPPRFVVAGRELPPQYVGCALVGAPYVQVMFDPIHTGARVEFELVSAGTALHAYTIGYDQEGFYTLQDLGELEPGRARSVKVSPTARGLLLATKQTGCPLEAALPFPAFDLELRR